MQGRVIWRNDEEKEWNEVMGRRGEEEEEVDNGENRTIGETAKPHAAKTLLLVKVEQRVNAVKGVA